MSTKFASATGNWSTMTWWTTAGGTTTTTAPGVGDDADLNGFVVTIDQDVTCDNIVGTTGSSAVSGNRTINANWGSDTSGFGGPTINGVGQTVTVNGSIRGGLLSKFNIANAATTLIVVGNLYGAGSGGGAARAVSVSPGTLTVTGNVTGGAGTSSGYAITTSGGTTTINGNVTGGTVSRAINFGGGTLTLNGNVLGGTGVVGMDVSAGSATVNGNVTGGSSGSPCYGITLTATGTLTVNGTVTAGSVVSTTLANGAFGIAQSGAGSTLNVTGNLVDGLVSAIIRSNGTFTYTPTNAQTAIIGGKTLYPAREHSSVG